MNKLYVFVFTLLTSFLFFQKAIAQQDKQVALKKVATILSTKKDPSIILADTSFDFIHGDSAFRKLIKQYATHNEAIIISSLEQGDKIVVKGEIINNNNEPVQALVYFYQTDTRGWYGSDRPHFLGMEGDRRQARLFGYLRTNEKGEFRIETIQPNGYPESDLPAHIHFEIYDNNGRALKITELLFDDDERLKGAIRESSIREGFYISKPGKSQGRKFFVYKLQL